MKVQVKPVESLCLVSAWYYLAFIVALSPQKDYLNYRKYLTTRSTPLSPIETFIASATVWIQMDKALHGQPKQSTLSAIVNTIDQMLILTHELKTGEAEILTAMKIAITEQRVTPEEYCDGCDATGQKLYAHTGSMLCKACCAEQDND